MRLVGPFDLILFAGQSNMAGRGEAELAPVCPENAGWEYRAVTAPDRLCPLCEPFGERENRPGGIDDGRRKTGSMVSAFAVEYRRLTGRAVVGVSASEGGTSIARWREALAVDAARRFEAARRYLSENGERPRHAFALWCQGETDGDHGVTAEEYRKNFLAVWRLLQNAGAEACGIIRIGYYNAVLAGDRRLFPIDADPYGVIREEQRRLACETPGLFDAGGLAQYKDGMRDEFHYHQPAYNDAGAAAARAAADYWGRGRRK